MDASSRVGFISLCVLLSSQAPSLANELSKTPPRDNSGRRLAVIIPSVPHPSAIPAIKAGVEQRLPPDLVEFPDRQPDSFRGRVISVISTPAEVSPEVKQVMEKGAEAAEGLSRITVKRLGDMGTWISTLWREINEFPKVTPVSPVMTPEAPSVH